MSTKKIAAKKPTVKKAAGKTVNSKGKELKVHHDGRNRIVRLIDVGNGNAIVEHDGVPGKPLAHNKADAAFEQAVSNTQ